MGLPLMRYDQNVTVLGGLDLVAAYEVFKAEPDVGIMSDWPDNITLHCEHGRAKWAEEKMSADDWDKLMTFIMENHNV